MSETKKRRSKRNTMDGTSRSLAQRHMIPVIRVTNPFDPRQFVREELAWSPTKTLAEYFPLSPTSLVISVNGKIIPKERQAVTYLDKTDNVVACPVPAGGDDDGKGILSMVAMIAVAVFAPYAAGSIASTMGVSSTIGVGLIKAGVIMAGSLLVHSIFAPSKKSDTKDSQTYGIDGAKNTALEGIPVPLCYGRFRMAGNIVGLYIENDGDTQHAYMLINAGEGPIASISDIEINDNPLSDYKDVEIETRLGTANQTPIPWFADTVVPNNLNLKLTTDWIHYTTAGSVDKVRIDIVAPMGLASIDKKKGGTRERHVDLEMEYRAAGSNATWAPIPKVSEVINSRTVRVLGVADEFADTHIFSEGRVYRLVNNGAGETSWLPETAPIKLKYAYDDTGVVVSDTSELEYLREHVSSLTTAWTGGADAGQSTTYGTIPVYGAVTRISGNSRNPVRKSFSSGVLAKGKYEFRIRRPQPPESKTDPNVLDELAVTDINEITLDDVAYANTALVGVKIRLTDQLNGIPKVTFINGGKIVKIYGKPTPAAAEQWYEGPSDSPAWVTWDMLTHSRYGGGMAEARMDFRAWKNWAQHCVDKNLTFNGVLDTEQTVWDATQPVLRCGHAQIVNVGTRFSVVVEKATDPVMMFSVANMIEGSYKETWLGTADRANEVDVTFYDKTDKYKARTIKVYDPAVIASGAKQRTSAVTLLGVDNHETALKEGQFLLNLNRKILKTVEFSAPLEAVACTVGDVVLVQNDMTDWAVAGRFEAGSTSSQVKLDRDVTMEAGKQYKLLAMMDAVQRFSGVVSQVIGTSVFLPGFTGQQTVKRLQANGRDVRVTDTFQGGVIVEDATGLAAGTAVSLWDTDVIEERGVVNAGGTSSVLTLQSPLTYAPEQFANWMFGETTKVKSPFRIKSITGSHEYKRDITALQYDPEVYDFDRYGSGALPIFTPTTAAIGHVGNLSAYEETYVAGEQIVSKVSVGWMAPLVGNYGGADVLVRRTEADGFEKVASVSFRTSTTIAAQRDETLAIKVVAFDVYGKRASAETAPVVSITVKGEVPDLDVGDVTGADLYWSGRDCKISWRYNATTHAYEFGSEPTGGDAGALDPHFKDYEIRVYNQDKTVLRRTEYTTDSSYTYTYDKNHADGLARYLTFEVRMRDKFNNLGKPAELDAYNPPPQVTAVLAQSSFDSVNVAYSHDNAADFAGAIIWISDLASDLANANSIDAAFKRYEGPDTSVPIGGLAANKDYFYRIAAYDAFGPTELLPTPVQTFKTTFLDIEAIADGVLGDSKLIPALKERIDLIDADEFVADSVNARINHLREDVFEGENGLPAAMAKIIAIDDVSATSTSANAKSLYELKAQVNDPETGLPVALAQIDELNNTSASSTSALAQYARQLRSRMDNVGGVTLEQAMETQADINGTLGGQYTVKMETDAGGTTYAAGFGLAMNSDGTPGGTSSEFIVRVDKFAVIHPLHQNLRPFTIGTVNGQPGKVIIDSAIIGDANIGTLKINGDAVTVPITATQSWLPNRLGGTGVNNWQQINKVKIVLDQPGIVYAMATISQNFGTGVRHWEAQLLIDGVLGPHIGGEVVETGPALSMSRMCAAGTHEVTVKWFGKDEGVGVYSCELFVMGAKR